MERLKTNWNAGGVNSKEFICGYCGRSIASDKAFVSDGNVDQSYIYICHFCNRPTFFERFNHEAIQYPGALYGGDVLAIPSEDVNKLYSEARRCLSVNAFTASVLCSRKLIMNIAYSKGAKPGLHFVEYVNFLEENNYIPPDGREWVDHIRTKGNEATHEIEAMEREDAEELIDFIYMLLKFIYEFPALMNRKLKGKDPIDGDPGLDNNS